MILLTDLILLSIVSVDSSFKLYGNFLARLKAQVERLALPPCKMHFSCRVVLIISVSS